MTGLVAAAFVSLVLTAGSMAGSPAGPLLVSPDRADIENIRQVENGRLEFTITNSEDTDVALTYIYAECDCSFVMPDCGIVPAHGEFILGAEFQFAELDGEGLNEMITILTDHPRQKQINIPITVAVHSAGGDGGSGKSGG